MINRTGCTMRFDFCSCTVKTTPEMGWRRRAKQTQALFFFTKCEFSHNFANYLLVNVLRAGKIVPIRTQCATDGPPIV